MSQPPQPPQPQFGDFRYHRDADRTNVAFNMNEYLDYQETGAPGTYGGVLRDKSNAPHRYQEFVTASPPDLGTKTHVVAVLALNQMQAQPWHSGWMASDFWAMMNLFGGRTKDQFWLHCVDWEELLNKYEVYLHGNPFLERKVVLNKEIYERYKKHLHTTTPFSMRERFNRAVRDTLKAAKVDGGNVLVMLFGHGEQTGSFYMPEAKPTSISGKYLAQILNSTKDVSTTVMSNSCYSAKWLYVKNFNSTAILASMKPSHAWTKCASLPRSCGSVFASAVIQKLIHNPQTGRALTETASGDDEDEVEQTEAQYETYHGFQVSVCDTMVSINRRINTARVWFSAQDDNWGALGATQTAFPSQALKARWDALPNYPADRRLHPGDWENRDPNVTPAQRADYMAFLALYRAANPAWTSPTQAQDQEEESSDEESGTDQVGRASSGKKRKLKLMNGEQSIENFFYSVEAQANIYKMMNPGDEDIADNIPISNLIQWVIEGNRKNDFSNLIDLAKRLEYRLKLVETVESYLEALEIDGPDSKSFVDFDDEVFEATLPRDPAGKRRHRNITDYLRNGPWKTLLPDPPIDAGEAWSKPMEYLEAAVYRASDHLSQQEIQMRFSKLVSEIDKAVTQVKETIKLDATISNKRMKLCKEWKCNPRDLSPERRSSMSEQEARSRMSSKGQPSHGHHRQAMSTGMPRAPLSGINWQNVPRIESLSLSSLPPMSGMPSHTRNQQSSGTSSQRMSSEPSSGMSTLTGMEGSRGRGFGPGTELGRGGQGRGYQGRDERSSNKGGGQGKYFEGHGERGGYRRGRGGY